MITIHDCDSSFKAVASLAPPEEGDFSELLKAVNETDARLKVWTHAVTTGLAESKLKALSQYALPVPVAVTNVLYASAVLSGLSPSLLTDAYGEPSWLKIREVRNDDDVVYIVINLHM